MNEKNTLLLRHLRKIQAHGYYHQVDMALVDYLLGDAPVKEICAKYEVSSDALYKQKSRLSRQRQEIERLGEP